MQLPTMVHWFVLKPAPHVSACGISMSFITLFIALVDALPCALVARICSTRARAGSIRVLGRAEE